MSNKLHDLPLAVIAVCFVVLTLTLTGSVTPKDVLHEVQSTRLELSGKLISVDAHIDEIDEELGRRGKWMSGIDDELDQRTKDRVFRSEVKALLEQIARDNPELKVPTLEEKKRPAIVAAMTSRGRARLTSYLVWQTGHGKLEKWSWLNHIATGCNRHIGETNRNDRTLGLRSCMLWRQLVGYYRQSSGFFLAYKSMWLPVVSITCWVIAGVAAHCRTGYVFAAPRMGSSLFGNRPSGGCDGGQHGGKS